MFSGASQCDLAVLLVGARKGIVSQTSRHSHIVFQLGIRDVVLAANKIDLVGFSPKAFESIWLGSGDNYLNCCSGWRSYWSFI